MFNCHKEMCKCEKCHVKFLDDLYVCEKLNFCKKT